MLLFCFVACKRIFWGKFLVFFCVRFITVTLVRIWFTRCEHAHTHARVAIIAHTHTLTHLSLLLFACVFLLYLEAAVVLDLKQITFAIMFRVQRKRQAVVSLDSISNTISRRRRRYAPLALCLLLSAFAVVTFCRRLPGATAAAAAAAIALLLLDTPIVRTQLKMLLARQPLFLCCEQASCQLRWRRRWRRRQRRRRREADSIGDRSCSCLYNGSCVQAFARASVCVCKCRCFGSCCRCRCQRCRLASWDAKIKCIFLMFVLFCAVPFALGLIAKEHRVYWVCVIQR